MISEVRRATHGDVFPILELYQYSAVDLFRDPLFLDHRKVAASISDDSQVWLVQAGSSGLDSLAVINLDKDQRLAKITRWYQRNRVEEADPEQSNKIIQSIIDHTDEYADLLYLTNRYLSFQQMEGTFNAGFKILGFFPLSLHERVKNPAALCVRYRDGLLEATRKWSYMLHPMVSPFYRVLRNHLPLPEMGSYSCQQVEEMADQAAKDLEDSITAGKVELSVELLEAPRFTVRRFEKLRDQSRLSNDFYPFQMPNAIITDPEGEIEVFVARHNQLSFAAVIEERLERPVHPVSLYSVVTELLHDKHLKYVEMIVDASDVVSIEYMLRTGFTPILMFPAMKKHGAKRRDYLVLGHTYEKLLFCLDGMIDKYSDFVEVYTGLEKNMLARRARASP